MKYLSILILTAFASLLSAQDYGDAPANYGLIIGGSTSGGCQLGPTRSNDTANPVTPAWTGDLDDGVVGNPVWNSWSNFNTLTVNVGNSTSGYLYMFVDANDSGTFEQSELYTYARQILVSGPADFTFTGIQLKNPGGYTLNGADKVAVRIIITNMIGGAAPHNPSGLLYIGEVEDWLIDVAPRSLAVSEDTLDDGEEAQFYDTSLQPLFGTGPYFWTKTAGTLPTGLNLVQVGDNFELTGTPAVGSAGVYSIDVEVTDGIATVATRNFILRILPVPFAIPFKDNFSGNMHWALEDDWAIGAATGYVGSNFSYWSGSQATEPATDYTPGNTDNKVLMSSPGAEEPDREKPVYATSPIIDCSGISNVQLEFRRWYSILGNAGNPATFWMGGSGDKVTVEITSDGQTWDLIWEPPYNVGPASVADVMWSKIQVDISQWAANQPWIRIRFTVGASYHESNSSWSTSGYTGWAIDEFIVRETPMSSPLVAHSFELASPGSFQDSATQLWYPIAYPGSVHDWTVKIDNPTSEAVIITEIDVQVPYAAASVWPSNPQISPLLDVSFDWGPWTLDQPMTIPAYSNGIVVSGKFDFQFAPPPNLALVLSEANLDLIGTHGAANTPVELRATETFGLHFSSMPGMYLFEAQAGTTPISNGQSAVNLRDFGSIAVNWSSNWLNIVIDHTSSGTLNLGMPTITGTDANQFTINTNSYVSQLVGNAASTYFSLVFTPTSLGQKTATVTFTHDAPNTGTPFTFEITGFGAGNGPVMKVFEGTITGAQIGNGSPANGGRDFGQVDIVAGSGQLTIAIENQGNQNLILGTPTITGTGASKFSLNTTGMLATVAASGSTTFVIDFDPAAMGMFTAAIEFTHNDPGTASAFIINITGEGIVTAPFIEVREGTAFGNILSPGAAAVGSRNFGTVLVGAAGSTQSHIIIHNAGWVDLTLGTPVLTGSNAGSFSLSLNRYFTTVPADGYTLITVTFDPLAKGIKTATLEFTHNDTTVVSPFTLEFIGIGDDPNGVVVTSTIMLEAREGNSYSDVLQASGGTGPYTWVEVSTTLNPGLTIDSDGTIHGTPVNGDGNYNTFQVMVTDALGGTEYGVVKIRIQPPIGFLGEDPNGGSGGCVSVEGNNIWILCLLSSLLLAVLIRRRQQVLEMKA